MKVFAIENTIPAVPVAERIVELASRVVQLVRSEVRQHQTTGLPVSQIRALKFLKENPGASLSDVAESLGLGAPTVSKAINELVEGGMVSRTGDSADRRRVTLHATAGGLAALREASEVAHAQVAKLLEPLDGEEVAAVERAISLLQPLFCVSYRCESEGE
jgi:DNA-binding MarR family transcriptional regulator